MTGDDLAAAGVEVLRGDLPGGIAGEELVADARSCRWSQPAPDLLRRTRRCCRSCMLGRRRATSERGVRPAAARGDAAATASSGALPGRSICRKVSTASREKRCRLTSKSSRRRAGRPGTSGTKPGCGQVGRAADGVEDVRGQREVQHLLDRDDAEDVVGVGVGAGVDRVERRQVRRDRGVLELQRRVQVAGAARRRVVICGEGIRSLPSAVGRCSVDAVSVGAGSRIVVRAPEAERGEGQRDVGRADRGHAAAADQVEVLVVPGALVGVHHGVARASCP